MVGRSREHLRLFKDPAAIQRRVQSLGKEITPWAEAVAQRSGQDLVVIPVLRGAIFFFADLVRSVECSVEIAPAQSWRYDAATNRAATADPTLDLRAVQPRGRHLLVVDDICDSGNTLRALCKQLSELGAAEVRTAVLIRRDLPAPAMRPDWVGFEFSGDDWFVGYGMDDGGAFRNLPAVYLMRPKTSSEPPSRQ